MSDQSDFKTYFKENASLWIGDAYNTDGYNYPVGLHRLRIILDIYKKNAKPQSSALLDIGCGGGNLCLETAKLGYKVDGVDGSMQMIDCARQSLENESEDVASRIQFHLSDVADLDQFSVPKSYDAASALGFAGYMENDDILFEKTHRLLKDDGLFIVSFRNRLFNMFPGSKYMRTEIEAGTAISLLDEIDDIYQQIDNIEDKDYLNELSAAASSIMQGQDTIAQSSKKSDEAEAYSLEVEPRQHTPQQIKKAAEKNGFAVEAMYGVHPHWGSPKLTKLFAPSVYNKLSNAMCVWESSPLSLIWSSVFMVVFKKK